MAQRPEVYACNQCGNVVEVLRGGAGNLACCDQAMQAVAENTVDASKEKHVPAIARAGSDVTVTIGTVPHPMGEEHFIEWVEIEQGDAITRRYLKPGAIPQATFEVGKNPVTARAYCNLHGLWKARID